MAKKFRDVGGHKMLKLKASDVGVGNYLLSKGVLAGSSGTASVKFTPITSTAQLPASPTDGDMVTLRVGTWPDTAKLDLVYSQAASALAGRAIWEQIGFYTLITMGDQGYMGLPTNGTPGTTDNSALGLVYQPAGSFNVLNAGNPNQTGYTVTEIEYADLFQQAGMKLQARQQGFYAGTGTAPIYVIPLFMTYNSGDAPGALGASPRLAPQAETISVAASEAANRAALTSPNAAIAGGVQWLSTGWVNMTEVNAATLKRMLYAKLFAKMPNGAVASPNPAGAMIDIQVAARWTT